MVTLFLSRNSLPSRWSRIVAVASVLISATCATHINPSVGQQLDGFKQLPPGPQHETLPPNVDYLIDPSPFRASVYRSADDRQLVLENGLIRRTWRCFPNGACVGFDNLMTGEAMLRSVRPEARVSINGNSFDVGGLTGQPNHAFLTPQWLEQMQADPNAFQLVRVSSGPTIQRLAWQRRRHHAMPSDWPPPGIQLRMEYRSKSAADPDLSKILITVHHEIYDGLPVVCKWLTVRNETEQAITLDRFRAEELAVVEHTNWVELRGKVQFPNPDYLHVETDFAFGGFNHENANRHTIHWRPDPEYSTQVNYLRKTPCLLVVEPTYGPSQEIAAGGTFESFRVFELVYDRADRERRGLALRKMYRTLAPWVTENPLTHHLLSSDPAAVKQAIDNAAAVGFEAVILSFGSGFNMENTDPAYLKTWKTVADYAESKGIELGAYSLFSSRSVGGGNDVVSPPGQQPTFGKAPAATSAWGIKYFEKLQSFFDQTGFDQFENDGPYPGDVDVTPRPPYQTGEQDSRWAQWKIVTGLYRHLRATGVYINQPDYYFLVGGNKTGMGYREVNWSLPRAQQVIHTRQNIYDGTWTKTPSMGWMHVPLTQYHGGGAAATIEPLNEHLDHYELMMRSNLGMGVQAHYRGPRLFDTEQTRDRVTKVVDWYKQYREILESDIIHGRRADGRELDWILHVNPQLEHKGMLCVYNPADQQVTQTIRVNAYYTGLTDTAIISEAGRPARQYQLARDGTLEITVNVPANGMQWYLIQ